MDTENEEESTQLLLWDLIVGEVYGLERSGAADRPHYVGDAGLQIHGIQVQKHKLGGFIDEVLQFQTKVDTVLILKVTR